MNIMDITLPIKIIVAEDESLYRKIIIDFLNENEKFKVIGEAKDGETAVKLAKELIPNLMVIDLGLPVMSGIEAITKIKKSNPTIKIVVLTSHINQDEAIESLAAGANAYVDKGININNLKMIIETVNNGAVWISPIIGQRILHDIINEYKNKHKNN
ncbi:MAG: response regulator transcription factor [bacterium]